MASSQERAREDIHYVSDWVTVIATSSRIVVRRDGELDQMRDAEKNITKLAARVERAADSASRIQEQLQSPFDPETFIAHSTKLLHDLIEISLDLRAIRELAEQTPPTDLSNS